MRFLLVALSVLPVACSNGGNDDAGGALGAGKSSAGAGGGAGTQGALVGGAGGGAAAGAAAGSSNLAGTSGTQSGDATLIVPAGLTVTAVEGGDGGFDVLALTLRNGDSGPELYVALKNDGTSLACSAGFQVELFDQAHDTLGSWITGLLTPHIYRLGSGDLSGCIAPGDTALAAITDLPAELDIHQAAFAQYLCNFFASVGEPVGGFTATPTGTLSGAAGTVYTGTFVNGMDVAVNSPLVTVFPVNRVGRPLAVATATGSAADHVAPGGSWDFTTSGVDSRGVDVVMIASAALER
ncbi:MAG TPA: hypothetical protein VGQ57_04005 [Polyangiaceae bacterium]|nr:hypothetical protein [Polyangiaceae bacterium]